MNDPLSMPIPPPVQIKTPMMQPQPMAAEYEVNRVPGPNGVTLILVSFATPAGLNHIWFSEEGAKALAQKLTAVASGIVLLS